MLNHIVFDQNIVARRFQFTELSVVNNLKQLLDLVFSWFHFNEIDKASSCHKYKLIQLKEHCQFLRARAFLTLWQPCLIAFHEV